MEFMDVVRKRRSVRKYKPDMVPGTEILYVLEAARLAPSWGNRQCWRYIVVTDEATRKKIAITEWAASAPVIIVGCGDPSKAGNKDGKPYYMLDMELAWNTSSWQLLSVDLGHAGWEDNSTRK